MPFVVSNKESAFTGSATFTTDASIVINGGSSPSSGAVIRTSQIAVSISPSAGQTQVRVTGAATPATATFDNGTRIYVDFNGNDARVYTSSGTLVLLTGHTARTITLNASQVQSAIWSASGNKRMAFFSSSSGKVYELLPNLDDITPLQITEGGSLTQAHTTELSRASFATIGDTPAVNEGDTIAIYYYDIANFHLRFTGVIDRTMRDTNSNLVFYDAYHSAVALVGDMQDKAATPLFATTIGKALTALLTEAGLNATATFTEADWSTPLALYEQVDEPLSVWQRLNRLVRSAGVYARINPLRDGTLEFNHNDWRSSDTRIPPTILPTGALNSLLQVSDTQIVRIGALAITTARVTPYKWIAIPDTENNDHRLFPREAAGSKAQYTHTPSDKTAPFTKTLTVTAPYAFIDTITAADLAQGDYIVANGNTVSLTYTKVDLHSLTIGITATDNTKITDIRVRGTGIAVDADDNYQPIGFGTGGNRNIWNCDAEKFLTLAQATALATNYWGRYRNYELAQVEIAIDESTAAQFLPLRPGHRVTVGTTGYRIMRMHTKVEADIRAILYLESV